MTLVNVNMFLVGVTGTAAIICAARGSRVFAMVNAALFVTNVVLAVVLRSLST